MDVKRSTVILDPDRTHVLARPFRFMSDHRSVKISARVMALPENDVHTLLEAVRAEFGDRQLNIDEFLLRRFDDVSPYLLHGQKLSDERKLLLGGYFTHEYSLEAAALFNPSMVPHPDQSDVPPGSLRFILSLRATAEGHVSSIAFRSGLLDANCNIAMDLPSRYSFEPVQVPNATFEKPLFERKLQELRLMGGFNREVLNGLPDVFTMEELRASIGRAVKQLPESQQETTKGIARETLMLAQSNYEVQFTLESGLSERVLFPVTPSQSNGIEDARFVLFHNEDGTRMYYATYTAYDGRMILPQFLETSDFLRFKFITLNGPAVENKGMALFPRKIGGRYVMLGRQDAENIYVMFSDHLHFWHTMQLILEPRFPWEFVQLGNCGSPIETEAGWLVISHGVGAMRKYCIGAFLLDRDDPTKVLGRLPEPLIKPNIDERDGYVPNVVYSCGSLVHGGQLVIPYGISDYATTFATLPLDQALAAME
ncbi:MAG: glycoside hydrolase family 130 protein [Bryobacteraceae bacterium]